MLRGETTVEASGAVGDRYRSHERVEPGGDTAHNLVGEQLEDAVEA
jgi:hypothetical protein